MSKIKPLKKILTRHPQGKSGKNVSKKTYELFKDAILSALKGKELTHTKFNGPAQRRLNGKFQEYKLVWRNVKLDLKPENN
jgi:hypothetical protein